jgi:hypothetical protein
VTTAAGQKIRDTEPTMPCRDWGDLKQVVIPDGMYFVAGDNRGNSLDSRVFGPISKSQIHTKVLAQIRLHLRGDHKLSTEAVTSEVIVQGAADGGEYRRLHKP